MIPLRDNVPSIRRPYITVTLIVFNVLIYLFQFVVPDEINKMIIYSYGFIPGRFLQAIFSRQVTAVDFYPFITSSFLHGNWVHLVGNMWILWLFGDNVEDRLGHFKFIIFYFLSGCIAMFCHFMFNPGSPVPAIGASGAIAGVMGAYFILFPHSRILTIIPFFIIPLFIRIPAAIYLIIWFLMQIYSGTLNSFLGGMGRGVAWWAHIGGFLSGILLLKLLHGKNRRPVYYYNYYKRR
jgi:membrane associated rhomboid family serine protease